MQVVANGKRHEASGNLLFEGLLNAARIVKSGRRFLFLISKADFAVFGYGFGRHKLTNRGDQFADGFIVPQDFAFQQC